jgi:hypothetical protein
MHAISLRTTALAFAAVLAGCASGPPSRPASALAPVGHVRTEHSAGLECIGALIDETGRPPVTVFVDGIDDRTVPSRFRERRLSKGGEWLVYTALAKVRSPRVAATLVAPATDDPRVLVMSGAWTQDDALLRSRSGAALGRKGDVGFDFGTSGRYDYIAADLVSSVAGRITHASAIGLALSERSMQAALIVDTGGEQARFGWSTGHRDGPQFAQRRIAEAAVLVHLAAHFGIDHAPCLALATGEGARWRDALARWDGMAPRERHLALQRSLASAGYLRGKVDGVWGAESRAALQRFQRERGLPARGAPSGTAYALLRAEDPAVPAVARAG